MRLYHPESCSQSKQIQCGKCDENMVFLFVSCINVRKVTLTVSSSSSLFPLLYFLTFWAQFTNIVFIFQISGICTQVDGNITVFDWKEEADISESGQINPKLSECQNTFRNK